MCYGERNNQLLPLKLNGRSFCVHLWCIDLLSFCCDNSNQYEFVGFHRNAANYCYIVLIITFLFNMVLGNNESLLAWVADGYKHKLFANDATQEADIRPCETDSFVLSPEEEACKTFAELRVVTPDCLVKHTRIRSAVHIRESVPKQRPGTAPARTTYLSPYSQQAISGTSLRPSSSLSTRSDHTGSGKLSSRQYNDMRQGFTLVNKLYESANKRKINLHPAGPDPDFRYFDRHSRCYGYTHMHGDLLKSRPQRACDEHPCEGYPRPGTALSNASRSSTRTQRYVNSHRPRSSPLTRKELLTYSRSTYLRRSGYPRFCDIVRQKEIHSREHEKRDGFDEDFDDDFYHRQHDRWRKHSDASQTQEELVNQIVNEAKRKEEKEGGTQGRPGSPSGVDIENAVHKVVVTGKPAAKKDTSDKKEKYTATSLPSERNEDEYPVQPPPTPEPLTVIEDKQDEDLLRRQEEERKRKEEEEERRRRALVKKTKQPIQRVSKPKEDMEEKKEPPKESSPPVEPSPPPEKKDSKDIKVEIDVPNLPTISEKKKEKKEKKKAERHLVTQPKHEEPPTPDPEEELDEQLRQRLKNFNYSIMEMTDDSPRKINKTSWVTGRLALSQQSSRFTLPIDMARLEKMSALDYVKNFCVIKRRRKKLYQDIYLKHREKTISAILFKDLEKALKMVLVNTITTEDYNNIVNLLDISESTKVDLDTFSAIAALAERLLCASNVTQDQVDQPDYQKEKIECADFSALDWKLTGVDVNPKIVKILKELN